MTSLYYTESTEDLLEVARNEGYIVVDTTLARWHRKGLIQNPYVKRLGKAHGTVSLYPTGTKKQLIALLEIRQQIRSLDEIGFRLWLQGFPVAENYSIDYLRTVAAKYDQTIERLKIVRDDLNSDDEDLVDRTWGDLQKVTTVNIPIKFVRKLRKRVGRKNFDAAAILIIDIATGNFRGFEDERHDQVMRTMMGINKVRSTILNGSLIWLKGPISKSLTDLSILMGEQSLVEKLALESEKSLDDARSEFTDLFFGLASFSKKAFDITGLKIPGFYQILEVMNIAKATDLAWMLIVWCRMRRMPWAEEYPAILHALRSVGIIPERKEQI